LVSLAKAQNPCITNPLNSSCATYQPNPATITAESNALCMGGMADMPGCTVKALCQSKNYKSQYCDSFSIYKDICVGTMSGMPNCSIYTSMCREDSVVQECNTPFLPLPDSETLQSYIDQICEMNMAPCAECKASSCEYLQVYSELCMSMPDMANCTDWRSMCKLIPDWSLCSQEASLIPIMRMFFHWGKVDYVLFEKWVPYNDATYAAAWVGTLVFTILWEVLKLFRSRLEKRWSDDGYVSINGPGVFNGEAQFSAKKDITRAIFHTVELAWGFLVMLIVMTYNIGLCFAVLAGAFIGSLLVGRIERRAAIVSRARKME